MKKLFLLLPLTFLALTGCGGETAEGTDTGADKETNTQTEVDTHTQDGGEVVGSLALAAPSEDGTFYLGMTHPGSTGKKENIEAGLYLLTGRMAAAPAQYFMETAFAVGGDAPATAATIKTVKDGDGWNLKVVETGEYIAAKKVETHRNAVYQAEKYKWSYNAEQHTFVTKLDNKDVILGTQHKEFTYDTVGIVDANYTSNIFLQLYA